MTMEPSIRHRARRLALAAALAAAAPVAAPRPAGAVETRVETYRTSDDFADGEMDHVSIAADGRLVPSPAHRRLAEIEDPVAWSAAWAGGDVIVGTGHDGRVLRVPGSGGRPTVLLDTEELEVYAVAVAADGTVYAGSSPDGKVYAIAPGGAARILFDPEERYVWALLAAPDGSLYVATGDRGAVYRVAKDGSVAPVLVVDETHILSLALGADGTLYAGSASNGYVYRRGPDGAAMVLLDTAGTEVKALLLDDEGNLYAASTGRPTLATEAGPPAPSMSASITVFDEGPAPSGQDEGMPAAGGEGEPAAPAAPSLVQHGAPGGSPARVLGPGPLGFAPAGPRQSWVYRIRPDGLPLELWRTSSATVHAMARIEGRLVLGTGDEGKVLSLDPVRQRLTILLDLPVAQVTALAPDRGRLAAVTSNLAAAWQVETAPAETGTYLSPVIDAGHFATWGRLRVDADGPVKAATRTGNTEKPGPTWSAWAPSSGEVTSPRARYLQFRLTLDSAGSGGGGGPVVREVELAYLPFNLAPRLRSIEVLDPHVKLVSAAPQAAGPQRPSPGRAAGPGQAPPRAQPRQEEQFGARSVRWEVDDPNGDEVVYWVSYRGAGEQDWKPLAEELAEPFVSFDSTAFPDGTYTIRVEASDEPSNPDALALQSEIETEPFQIDNTAPRVEVLDARAERGGLSVRARAADRMSVVEWAEYAIDGGPWRPLVPEDMVFDEREESFAFRVEETGPGEHTVVVRAQDVARNVGSGKLVTR